MTEMKIIARIRTELPEKFGVPRQSGLVPQLRGRVIFEPEYRNPDAVRGLEDFSHIWLIWQFSRAVRVMDMVKGSEDIIPLSEYE